VSVRRSTRARAYGPRLAFHHLVDTAEDRVVAVVAHFDLDPVAAFQEAGFRRALGDGLNHTQLGDAGIADAALRYGSAGAAILVAVGNRARADDRAGAKWTRLRRMLDEGREIESHVDSGLRLAGRSEERRGG